MRAVLLEGGLPEAAMNPAPAGCIVDRKAGRAAKGEFHAPTAICLAVRDAPFSPMNSRDILEPDIHGCIGGNAVWWRYNIVAILSVLRSLYQLVVRVIGDAHITGVIHEWRKNDLVGESTRRGYFE